MKTLFILLSFLSVNVFAQTGLTIPNAFQVDREGSIFRGKEPKKLVAELALIGITDVLIFKNEMKTEVTQEILDLELLGIRPHHIPFQWKNFESIENACAQVVEALQTLSRVKSEGGKIFFHCTAGEDRTGMLAGLYRMLEEKISREEAFSSEMCARGYSDGNVKKPGMVTGTIQKELTPLFIALSDKILSHELSMQKLDPSICRGLQTTPTKLKCRIKN